MTDEVNYGKFLDMTDNMLKQEGQFEPYIQEIAQMTPGEKHRAFLGEFDNGTLIINYHPTTDGLTNQQKDHLIDMYELDLKLKYNDQKEVLNLGATFWPTIQGKFDWAKYEKDFSFSQIWNNETSYEDLDDYTKSLFEIYHNLEPLLKTVEGKTSADFNANWQTMKQDYEIRMEPVWEQEKIKAKEMKKNEKVKLKENKKANKLKNKLGSLIPKKRMFGKGYWYNFDENYVEAVDAISDDLKKYISSVENNDLFSNYQTVFTDYKTRVQTVQSEIKEKIKNKDFKSKLKFNRFKDNWGLKCNQNLMSNKDYENKILEIKDRVQKDIDSVNIETLDGFNYKRKIKEYNSMIKEAEKEVRAEAKQRRRAIEQKLKEERKAKLFGLFKPKIGNGRMPN